MWNSSYEFPLKSVQKPLKRWDAADTVSGLLNSGKTYQVDFSWPKPPWGEGSSITESACPMIEPIQSPSPHLLASIRSLTKTTKHGSQPKETNEPAGKSELGPERQVTGKGKHYPTGNKVFMLWRVKGPRSHWRRQSSPLTVLTSPGPC